MVMKRRTRRRRARSGRQRRTAFNQSFNESTDHTAAWANGVTTQAFTYADIVTSLNTNRQVQLRRIRLEFSPTGQLTPGACITVQVLLIDQVTGVAIPYNRGMMLNLSTRTVMNMSIPMNFQRFVAPTSMSAAFALNINNTGGTASYTVFTNCTFDISFDLLKVARIQNRSDPSSDLDDNDAPITNQSALSSSFATLDIKDTI
jgi:hypothetical protein